MVTSEKTPWEFVAWGVLIRHNMVRKVQCGNFWLIWLRLIRLGGWLLKVKVDKRLWDNLLLHNQAIKWSKQNKVENGKDDQTDSDY